MAIPIHKTGLNKTLGQKGPTIYSTDLIGNFDPTAGIASTHWTNQAASNALRRFNGITFNTAVPKNFEFDGTNDYLGQASGGYGGTAFTVAFQNAYTIGQWVYLPNTWASGKKHFFFYFYHGGSDHVMVQIDGATVKLHSYTSSGNLANISFTPSGPSMITNKNKWLYHTITHNGSGAYRYYINGSFVGLTSTSAPSATAQPMEVGHYLDQEGEGDPVDEYTSAGVKLGNIHVYSSALTNSQIRQNYVAIQSPTNTRLYGETALA